MIHNDSDDDEVKARLETKSYYSENELKLDRIREIPVRIPLPKYEDYCPKCKKIPEGDGVWLNTELQTAGARGFVSYQSATAFPRHCSNGHWWEPAFPKVYTEDEMKDRMLTRLDAGNPQAKIIMGYHDFTTNQWVKTDADKAYFAEHGWKAVSLTREEYYGAEAYNKALIEAARRELESIRKTARQLTKFVKEVSATMKRKPVDPKKARQAAARAKKIAAEMKGAPKGGRGKKKKQTV